MSTTSRVLTVAVAILTAGCAHWARPDDVVVSRSATIDLTADDYLAYLRGREVSELLAVHHSADKVRDLALDFHSDTVLAQEAESLGLHEQPEVAAQIDDYRRQVLVVALMNRVRAQAPDPDLAAVARERYLAEPAKFRVPERRRVAHILLRRDQCATEDDSELLQKARAIRERALSGEDFAALARQYSADRSAARGGELPGLYAKEGLLAKPFEDAMFSLQNVGDLSEPVETDFGIHLIKLLAVEPPHIRPFEEVQEELVKQLRTDILESAMRRKRGSAYPSPQEIQYDVIADLVARVLAEKGVLAAADSNDATDDGTLPSAIPGQSPTGVE